MSGTPHDYVKRAAPQTSVMVDQYKYFDMLYRLQLLEQAMMSISLDRGTDIVPAQEMGPTGQLVNIQITKHCLLANHALNAINDGAHWRGRNQPEAPEPPPAPAKQSRFKPTVVK